MVARAAVSVVICAYNEEDWISRTLDSLTNQQRPPDEVIVVNNNSSDCTAAVVHRFITAHPELNVKLVHESKQGLHHAREAGWRAASGDIIAMSDADIQFPPDWLHIIEQEFANPEISAMTGIVRYPEAPAFVNWVTWICDQIYQPEGIGKFVTDTYVLNGGNSAYRRSVLEAVNGYLDKPDDMLEDRWMSHQMKQAGFTIKFVRHLKVWHSFRRFEKQGWRGYMNYIFFYDASTIYADHLGKEQVQAYKKEHKITVIVPTFNEEKLVRQCLESLLAQDPLPDEILVVDNNSTDRTVSIVQAIVAKNDRVRLIFEKKQGCIAAREAAWRQSSGDIIVHVDADETFPVGWMARIQTILKEKPDLGAFGGVIRFENAPFVIWLSQVLYNRFYPYAQAWVKGFPYLCGGMTVVRRDVLEAINGYADIPANQLEDYYLARRAHEMGYKLYYTPSLWVNHSLRRYEQGGLKGFFQWGLATFDTALYEDNIR